MSYSGKKKNSNNAYQLELLENFGISSKFNVADIYEYHEGDRSANKGTLSELEQQLPERLSGIL